MSAKIGIGHWQETYNLSDLKHDPHCGFAELGGSPAVSGLIVTSTIDSKAS